MNDDTLTIPELAELDQIDQNVANLVTNYEAYLYPRGRPVHTIDEEVEDILLDDQADETDSKELTDAVV